MTARDMQNGFELEINKFDSDQIIESHIIFYWLNQAQDRLIKTYYSGNNPKGDAFEQTQKRIDDLRPLIKEARLYLTAGVDGINKPNSFIATIPADYWFAVNEEVLIQMPDITGNFTLTKRMSVTQSTLDTYPRQIADPYSEHILHYEQAKPLRLFKENYVELVTDGYYQINFYYLRYIKKPVNIDLETGICELPDHMHTEIVTKAVNLYLENIGDPRYQSNKIELNTNE